MARNGSGVFAKVNTFVAGNAITASGHNQNWDIHRSVRADGKGVIGLMSGSCYMHDEDYLGPQGNHYNRGIWMLYEVEDGDFHPLHISLNFLEKRYDY